MDAERLYVYALMDRRVAPPTFGRPGVRTSGRSDARKRRLEIIDAGGVFAAIERFAEAPPLSEEALRDQHQIVVRLARVAKAILPVRFGTWLEREELERVVHARQAVLRQALRDVHGKVQMTVRVFGPVTRSAPSPMPASGTEYLRARAALTQPRLPTLARAVVKAVHPFVSTESIDPGRGSIRVTINHLIDRKLVSPYVDAAERVIRSSGSVGRGPRAVVSGPWPPFAFVPDLFSSAMPLERLTP